MDDVYIYLMALSFIVLVLFIICVVLLRKVSFLTRRYQLFMADGDGASLEGTVHQLFGAIRGVEQEVTANRSAMNELAEVLDAAVGGVGVVRFNAFQDTGSDLSFAVAFLNARKSGVVLSSIYGREESRTYAKPLEEGRSNYPLSREEQEAVDRAAAALKPMTGTVGNRAR